VISVLEPLQQRYREFTADPAYIDGILARSVENLQPVVDETMTRVRQVMGLR